MSQLQLDQVVILLVDPDRGSRDGIRSILYNTGYRELLFGTSIEDILEHFKIAMPDLLIVDLEIQDGDICEFVRKMRHHEIGKNPFLPVISTTWSPTPALVKQAIDSGVDDVLPKPISSKHLSSRIMTLVEARKPFVVTSDYIGPDRHRSGDRPSTIPLMDVPNTLKAKATGDQSFNVEAAIAAAVAEVNLQKIERHADEIAKLVKLVMPDLAQGICDGDVYAQLEYLFLVIEDTERRMVGTEYDHVGELCQSLNTVVQSLLTDAVQGTINDKDIQLLTPLAQAISMSFTTSDQTATMARQISATVTG